MIGRVLLVCAVLSTGVRSLPVTPGQLESEDVKVMKCIVEALADVLSRPRPLPVSEDCLLTLRSDDRLVSILRHHNFLRELQDIALKGNKKRAPEESPVQQTPGTDETPDRSMLESLGGPGERSILGPDRRGESGGGQDDPPRDEGGAGRAHGEREEAETTGGKDKKGSEHSAKSVKKKSTEEFGEKREEQKKNGVKLWSKRAKAAQVKKKKAAAQEEEETEKKRGNQEIPHHSKEVSNQEAEDVERRSPEEEELQLIARTAEEREDEGSGAKKLDIESLATIESELESVAQKLHQLSRTDRGQQRA